MRAPTSVFAACLLLCVACSGEGESDPAGNDSGLPDTGADAALDASGDTAVEAGPCEPAGNWTWTFAAEAGAPLTDHVTVTAEPDAGTDAWRVTFLERQKQKDQCMPSDAGADAGPELIEATGTLDPKGCALSVGYSQSWCMSGEDQVESWDISLTLAGNAGQGTATRVSGWVMDKHTTQYAVTAQKN
ncbi:MAG: hypothetical protein L6Q84_04760 [Polyangiaceae bacterium]|nr:hypothetical protein [Polyangiaceae bacterium]